MSRKKIYLKTFCWSVIFKDLGGERDCELRKGRLSKVGQDCDTAVMHGPAMIDLC